MKIGIITDSYYPQLNGVVIAVDNLTRELRALGHEVYIFAPFIKNYKDKDKNIFRLSSFKVLSSEPAVFFPIPTPQKGYEKIFNIKLDIIHAHGNGAFSFLGCQIAKLKGIPFVMTFHSVHTKYTHYFMNGKVVRPGMVAVGLRMFADICDGIITPSQKMKNELVTYGVKKDIKVIPGFIDSGPFQKSKKGYLHQRFSIPNDHKILLSVGRLGKEKNFPFLINMFKKLEAGTKDVHLVIAGHGWELARLQALVAKLGLSQKIHFTEKVDSSVMPEVYADADIFVFSSTTETQGICVLEAAASGLPLVVVKDPAYANLAVDGKTGFNLPANQKIFAQKVRLLLKDDKLRLRFGRQAREMVKKNFRSEPLTRELVKYYREVKSTYEESGEMWRKINRATLIPIFRATNAVYKFINS